MILSRFGFADELEERFAQLGNDALVEVRILQHKEPQDFLAIFDHRIVIYKESSINTTSLFHVRGFDDNTRATQVSQVHASALCSSDSFVLINPCNTSDYEIYVWHGTGAEQSERYILLHIHVLTGCVLWAETLANGFQQQLMGINWHWMIHSNSELKLPKLEWSKNKLESDICNRPSSPALYNEGKSLKVNVIIMEEGTENLAFWAALGGYHEYANAEFLKNGSI